MSSQRARMRSDGKPIASTISIICGAACQRRSQTRMVQPRCCTSQWNDGRSWAGGIITEHRGRRTWSNESYPRNGATPTKSSTRRQPNDHISTCAVAGRPSKTSGERYQRLWMYMFFFIFPVELASPKSMSWTRSCRMQTCVSA
eukprot:180191-Rhodomonas_salina.4